MKLTIAKSAGYCFGVKRAVNMVYQEAEEAKFRYTRVGRSFTMKK